jgi:hypothetical protein
VIFNNVSRLGAVIKCLNPPKGRRYYAYKALGVPLARTSLSSRPSLYTFLYFSFTIYLFPYIGRRPDLDGFHTLLINYLQLSLRFYHGIGLLVLEISNFLRYFVIRLYRSF